MIKQANKVESGKLFIFNGKKYQYISANRNWRQFADENGVLINPSDIPTELLIGKVKVEVQDDQMLALLVGVTQLEKTLY